SGGGLVPSRRPQQPLAVKRAPATPPDGARTGGSGGLPAGPDGRDGGRRREGTGAAALGAARGPGVGPSGGGSSAPAWRTAPSPALAAASGDWCAFRIIGACPISSNANP